MRTKRCFTVYIAVVFGALIFWQFTLANNAVQAVGNKPVRMITGKWVQLQDYTSTPSRSIWVNLDKADTIQFYTTNYRTQQNVPQAMVMLGRNPVQVIEPKEIALLRRYVQTH